MSNNKGLAALNRRLEAIPREVREAVKPALMKAAEEIAETMRAGAPEDTGALIDSITITPGGQSTPAYSQPGGSHVVPDNAVAITAGDSDVRYAHLAEYGAEHAPAQPFFWSSIRLTRKRITARITRAINKAFKDAASR
jgi:HK97 gp10 family phage protein